MGGGIAAAAVVELDAPADPIGADVAAAAGARSVSAKPLFTYCCPLVRLASSIRLFGLTARTYAAM